jgi:dihydrofolate synthase/folylpolyglutamate synthase
MNYKETVEFLYSKLPYFTREGKSAIKKDLTNTIKLCEVLNNPHLSFKTIHIAGTNGKGSVSNMLSAVLQNNGYKTGLYTSPHLKDFRERIRIDGEMITEEYVVDFVDRIKPHIETIQPSFFEITVALCFDYFAQNKLDVAIIETGLGGRLDSTNIISPLLSIITNIGYDHMDLLGNTLPLIAYEKAGIIKNNTPVVIGETIAETKPVFLQKAKQQNAEIYFADETLNPHSVKGTFDLNGDYQVKNRNTVFKSLEILSQLGFNFDSTKTMEALQNVKTLTGFKGRWEVLNQEPKTIADTGHNIDGINFIVNQLKSEPYHELHMVIGMVKDKDRTAILKLLPKEAIYYFCCPNIPRGLDAKTLEQEAKELGLNGTSHPSVEAALNSAKNKAQNTDLIFIGGSTFVVAEII